MNYGIDDITIAVVTHGDHEDLYRRCVDSIMEHTPRVNLISCLNDVPYPYAVVPDERSTVIDSGRNIGIEGAIALALHACRTPVLVRLDDDSHILRDGWMNILLDELRALPPSWGALGRFHQFGFYSDAEPGQGYVSRPWVRRQPWCPARNLYSSARGAEAVDAINRVEEVICSSAVGVSGGFCALNVDAALAVGYPSDNYGIAGTEDGFWEEDMIMSIQFRANGFSLHNSILIRELDKLSPFLAGREPYIAVGDAPSRTDRANPRKKWKGKFA